jgi:Polyketide cyclase / dehydrase and lipid transport
MKERIVPMFSFALVSIVYLAAEPAKSADVNDGWKLATERNGVTIYSRLHSGSSLKEFKAVGEIAAPSRAVSEVIEDVDAYPSFMPYMAECRLLRRESDSLVSYQRISPKVCSDRDFTLRTYKTSWPGAAGVVYSNRWESANALGPAKKPGVVRVEICQGAWLLEPNGAARTRATYSVYTDTGGLIPAFIANHFSQSAIGEIFSAVRKQVKQPKYNAASKPISMSAGN